MVASGGRSCENSNSAEYSDANLAFGFSRNCCSEFRMTKNILRMGLGLSAYLIYNAIKKDMRSFDFKNKVVAISGGSRGLGLVLGRQLIQRGAFVALLARDAEELKRAQQQIETLYPQASQEKLFCQVCDSTQEIDIQEALAQVIYRFGNLDVLINNAGIISVMPYENTTIEDFDLALQTHFWAPLYAIRSALPHFKKAGGGRIINISSIGGKMALPHLAPYCASKFALVGLSDSLRAELSKDSIYVTTVCPGLMRTGSMGHAQFKGQHQKEFSWFAISDSLPLLSMNVERAAEKILKAAGHGRAELILSVPAKIAAQFRSFSPELCADLMSLANRFLPGPTTNPSESFDGQHSHSALAPSIATRLSEQAAADNNEVSI
jgi:short-subunit dehydrogenase